MPVEHPEPTPATAKELYGNALRCGFPACGEPLFVARPGEAVRRSLNSRIAHICARRENGPRWDSLMTADENRAAANLVLLCLRHAAEVDLPENLERYPVSLLQTWKEEQVAAFDRARGGGWDLSDEEAAEVIRVSGEGSIALEAQTIIVGGIGGLAPGASGGGGGAIGAGALGGPGGPVGRIDLEGSPGRAPGAGGGGSGSIAPGAIAATPGVAPRATEGRGFSAGVDGQDGGDTTLALGDEVLLRASGGRGGLAGTGERSAGDGLSVSTLLLANYAETRGSLVSIVGGGWQNYSLLNLPELVNLPAFVVFEAGGMSVGEYTAALEARGPDGLVRQRISFPVTVEAAGDVVRIPRCCGIPATIDAFGVWTVAVVTPDRELAHLELLIKRTGEADQTAAPS